MRMEDITVLHVNGTTPKTLEIGLKYAGVLYSYQEFSFKSGLTFSMSYLPPDEGVQHEPEHYEKTGREVLQVAFDHLGL